MPGPTACVLSRPPHRLSSGLCGPSALLPASLQRIPRLTHCTSGGSAWPPIPSPTLRAKGPCTLHDVLLRTFPDLPQLPKQDLSSLTWGCGGRGRGVGVGGMLLLLCPDLDSQPLSLLLRSPAMLLCSEDLVLLPRSRTPLTSRSGTTVHLARRPSHLPLHPLQKVFSDSSCSRFSSPHPCSGATGPGA